MSIESEAIPVADFDTNGRQRAGLAETIGGHSPNSGAVTPQPKGRPSDGTIDPKKTGKLVSIIIPYTRNELVGNAIRSVESQGFQTGRIEIIVVGTGASELVEQWPQKVPIDISTNLFPSKARNLGKDGFAVATYTESRLLGWFPGWGTHLLLAKNNESNFEKRTH